MNWLDLFLVAFIGFITWSAWRTGFIREVVSFAAVVLAIPIAGVFYKSMTPKVNPIVDNLDLARMISFSAILLGVIIAGQVGIGDHARIEKGAILGAQCGVPTGKVIKGPGVLFWGTPARPIRQYLKELAILARLAKK